MDIKTILHWLAFAVMLYIFGYAGIYKIVKMPGMMQGMRSMGFGEQVTVIIGWTEVLGVTGLLAGIFIPQVKPIAVLYLWPFAIGALTTHFSYHHGIADFYQALLVTVLPVILLMTDRHFKVSIT
jgi:uncharacterized membrane protein YphA (DoxX/SURF4 family)